MIIETNPKACSGQSRSPKELLLSFQSESEGLRARGVKGVLSSSPKAGRLETQEVLMVQSEFKGQKKTSVQVPRQ